MNPRFPLATRSRTFIRTAFGLLAAGLVVGASATIAAAPQDSESTTLKVYMDPEGDGTYLKTFAYDVSYEDAMREFAAAGGSPWLGEGTVLNRVDISGVGLEGPQSWDGFLQFLATHYPPSSTLANQRCDNTISVTLGPWSCGAPLDCMPVTDCVGLFSSVTVINSGCLGDPPCPAPKPTCVQVAIPNIVAFDTNGGTACLCDGFSQCVINAGATHANTGILFNNVVCRCVNTAGVPALGEWGIVVMVIALATTGILISRRQARMQSR